METRSPTDEDLPFDEVRQSLAPDTSTAQDDGLSSAFEQARQQLSAEPVGGDGATRPAPSGRFPDDEGGLFDDLASIATVATMAHPEVVTQSLAREAVDTIEEEGVGGLVSRFGEGVSDVLSEAGRMFYRGQSQEALDRARYILSEEAQGATPTPSGIQPKPFQEAPQEAARRAVERSQELRERSEAFEGAPAVQDVSRRLLEGDYAEAIRKAQEQPSFLPALGIGTMAQQLDALAVSAGLTAMASLAAPAGVPAMLAAAAGGAGGGFMSAQMVEGRAELANSLREAGVDLSDTEDVMEKLQDPAFREEVGRRIDKRVLAIGTVDALANLATMGFAASGMSRPITALLSAGGEIVGEGGGEALAQRVTEPGINFGEVALESLAGVFGPATVEAGTQLAAGGTDARTEQARETQSVREQIQALREQVEGGETDVDRPLREMEESALQSARQRALDANDQETVQLIDEELQARERDGDTGGEPEPSRSAEGREGAAGPTGARQRGAADRGEGRRARTPSRLPEQGRGPLAAVERARRVIERRRQAENRLGLGDIPEDPAPDVDARIESEADEQRPDTDQGDATEEEDQRGGVEEETQEGGEGAEPATSATGEARETTEPELAPDIGVRPETRPEEQVGEAVEAVRDRARTAEEQVQETEQQINDAIGDVETATLQGLFQQTQSERARSMIRVELRSRGEQGVLFEEDAPAATEEQPETEDFFAGEAEAQAESTSGLERLVQRLEQREAGLEQARQELLERRQQEAERRSQAREAQQEIDLDEDVDETRQDLDLPPEEAEQASVEELEEVMGEAEGRDDPEQVRVIQEELRKRAEAQDGPAVDYTPPGEDAGRMTLSRLTPEGREEVEATVTEETVQLEEDASPEALRAMADQAARRGKSVQTAPEVSAETAQALYELAQEGYDVVRATTASQTETGVQTNGEPAFRIRAPRLDEAAPTVETDAGVRIGRAAHGVRRTRARSARSDAFSNTSTEELRTELDEAIEAGEDARVQELQAELDRRANPPTQTTYRHEEGDLVAVDEDGRFIDRRAGDRYEEALAQYFAENEQELREGTIEPPTERSDEGAYTRAVGQSSDSPQQVLEAYLVQHSRVEQAAYDPVVSEMDAKRYSTASFDAFADPNWRRDSGQVTMNWLGGETSLDQAAQSITEATGVETTPQDIVDHIMENPGGPNRKTDAERTLERLAERFEALTGVRLTPDLAHRIQDEQIESLEEDASVEGEPVDDPFRPEDAPFQRMAGQDGRTGASALVEVYLRRFAAQLGADVNVVQDASELDGPAAEAYERGAKRSGEGFLQPAMFFDPPDGEPQVYVNASDLEAAARAMGRSLDRQAKATLMHEVVAHKGLRGLLGSEYQTTLEALYDAIGRGRLLAAQTADGTPLADAYAAELELTDGGELTDASKRLLVDEYLARVAEGMAVPETTLQRIFRQVRDAIQRVFGTRITESDLRLLLEASRDHLRGRQQRNSVSGTRFSRQASGSVPVARWMMVGREAEGFPEAEREGRTFEGLDEETRFEISDGEATFAEGPIRDFVESRRRRNALREGAQLDQDAETAEAVERAHLRFTEAFARLRDGVPLGEVLHHRRLYEQYPELEEEVTVVVNREDGASASYNEGTDTIRLHERPLERATQLAPEEAAVHLESMLRSLLHEIQHAIQAREGFARGDTPTRHAAEARGDLTVAQTLYEQNRALGEVMTVAQQADEAVLEADGVPQLTERQEEMGASYDWDVSAIQQRIRANNRLLRERGFNPALPRHRAALEGDVNEAQTWLQQEAQERYRRSAGEVEARLASERRRVPQEERMEDAEALRHEIEYDPEELAIRFSRTRESPGQQELFHDPESADAGGPAEPRNLVTVHNLDPQNIRFAVQQMDGYLPVPSLATVRYEEGLANFGDITLLGSPELIDPERGVPTFGGDAYTPTTPGPAYEGNMDAYLESELHRDVERWDAVLDKNTDSGLVAYIRDGNRDKFYSYLSREPAGLLAFLERQGEPVSRRDLPRRSYQGFMADWLKQDALESMLEDLSTAELNRLPEAALEGNEAYDPALRRRVSEAYEEATTELVASMDVEADARADIRESLVEVHANVDGLLSYGALSRLVRSYRKKQENPTPIDYFRVRERAKEQIQEVLGVDSWRQARQEMEAYWRDEIDPFSEPRMPDNRSRTYNLYNIVEYMRERGIRAAEGAGVNFLRALTIERFGSVEEAQALRDRVTSRDEYKQAASRLENQVERVWEKVKRTHQSASIPGGRPRRGALQSAIADYVARTSGFDQAKAALAQNAFEPVPADAVYAFMELVEQLQSEPVQYFESKPQRAVALSEFEAAIVPDDAPQDVREMLSEEVGRVQTYEAGSDADRQRVLAQESEEADVRFQRQQLAPQVREQVDAVQEVRNEDGQLLAPNGEPTNLDEVQWKLVRTPSFKSWFGPWQERPEEASQVVDENGEPKVVYHGTVGEHTVFDRSERGRFTEADKAAERGFFFVENAGDADFFAQRATERSAPSRNRRIVRAFLNARDPVVAELGNEGNIPQEVYQASEEQAGPLIDYANEVGADGVDLSAGTANDPSGTWIIFDSAQVKSATQRRGPFDPEDADIRFQRQEEEGGSALADERAEGDVPPNPNAITQDWSPRNLLRLAKREFRRWFAQRSLLPESVFNAKLERDGALAAGIERVRYALRDFGQALEATYDTDNPDPQVVERINAALQNGWRADLDPEQGELFVPDVQDHEDEGHAGNQLELFGAAPPMAPAVDPSAEQTLADMTFIEDLPERVQEEVGKMRDDIDALSQLGIKTGLFKGPLRVVVAENMGTYVTRSYRTHHEDGYGEMIKQAVREHANEDLELDPENVPESLGIDPEVWNRAVATMRGNFPNMSDEQLLGRLFSLLTSEEGALYEGGSKLGSVGQSIYERRKDIPGPLRDLMGEYKDPRDNYMRSMSKMLHAVTNQKFLNQVKQAGLGDWLIRKEKGPVVRDGVEYDTQIAAEGSRTMAPLNGLWTTSEIAEAFETFDQHNTGGLLYRWYMTLAGTVKEALTVYSPKLQVRNYTSAFFFGVSQGHMFDRNYLEAYRTAHPTSWNRIFKQEDDEAQRQLTQKLLRLGVLDESPTVGDIEDTWRDAGRLMQDPLEGSDNIAATIYNEVDDGARRAYQAGDNIHKIAGFLIERTRYAEAYPDKSQEEIDQIAAERVRNTFPTYSLVPKAIRALRANPFFSSFPSFFAEIVRNRANTLRYIKQDLSDPRTRSIGVKRAAGEILNASIWYGVMQGAMALSGVDDEMDEYFRRHMPSWEKYSYHIYYGFDEEEAELSFTDIGYLNPNATFHEPVLSLLGGEDIDEESAAYTAAYRFMEPFVSPEILTQNVFEALYNQRLEDGRPVYNPELTPERKIEEGAKHVVKDFVPGVLKQANQFRQAWAGDEEGYGENPPTKLESILEPLTGQNMRTIEFDNSWKWSVIGLRRRLSDAESQWYGAVTQRGRTSKEELEQALRESLDAQKRIIESAHKDLIGAQLGGVSEEQAVAIMQAQNLSDETTLDVLDGRFRPRPDYNILQGRIASERVSGNEEGALRLERRNEMVQEVLDEVIPEYRQPNDSEAKEETRNRLSSSRTQNE